MENIIRNILKDKDIYSEANKKFTFLCLNNMDEALELLNHPIISKYIDLAHNDGRAFEFAFISHKKNNVLHFKQLLEWATINNQITAITYEAVNNCILSATTSTTLKHAKENLHKINALYFYPELRSKINLAYADYGILTNLGSMKNKLTLDFLIEKEFESIVKKDFKDALSAKFSKFKMDEALNYVNVMSTNLSLRKELSSSLVVNSKKNKI